MRDCGTRSILSCQASDDELNCATFNNINRNLLAVGGEESGLIGVWDIRMPQMVINDLSHHTKQITNIEWHPTQE